MFHSDRQRAVSAYRHFMFDRGAETHAPFTECNRHDPRILGSDDFARRLLGDAWRPRSGKTLEELVTEACTAFGISSQQLHSPCRRHELVKARAWVAHQAITRGIASLAAVARLFGRDESSLRHGVKQHFSYP